MTDTMRGNAGPILFLFLLTALVGGFVYLAHHPDAAVVQQAETWPYVGPVASAFRQRFSRPRFSREGPSRPTPAAVPTEPQGQSDGRVIFELPVAPVGQGYVWVLPGMTLYGEPSAEAATLLQFEAIANVTRLEQRGDWYRVWYRGAEGWVYLEDYQDNVPKEPPFGRKPEPPRPIEPRPPDAETVAELLAVLEQNGEARELPCGPYRLHTDSNDDVLLADLDRTAAGLAPIYRQRTGRPLLGTAQATIVLFATRSAYRAVQQRSAQLRGLAAAGHSGGGLVLLYVGDRPPAEVRSTLVHELVHTLNRRALGPALPSWLDEGLAEELAFAQVDGSGRLIVGSLGGEHWHDGDDLRMNGGLAALWRLRRQAREARLPSLERVVRLDWEDFVAPGRGPLHYAIAGYWIRFLLDGDDGRHRAVFLAYLDAVASGEPATAEALRERLDASWTVLQARFELWLEFQELPPALARVS